MDTGDLVLVQTPSGRLIAQGPFPEVVTFSRQQWAQTGGRLRAQNGEPITYKAIAYSKDNGGLVLAQREVERVET